MITLKHKKLTIQPDTSFSSDSLITTNILLQKTIKLIFLILFLSVLFHLSSPAVSHGKSLKPAFENKYNTIYTGKSYKYNIINSPHQATIKFTTNNKKIATINSKSGILYSKKKGNVTIKAQINQTENSKKIILTKTIKIKPASNNSLNNSLLCPSSYINSINYTVRLKCLKIMQLSQVKSSCIYLTKGKHLMKGYFKKLSDDGRYVTYELDNNSIKKLTPGDNSMNGIYELSCTLSAHKFNINYSEHITGQSVTGFVFTSKRTAIKNAKITLSNNNFCVTSSTDKNGYYNIRFPKAETVTMTVSNNNYYTRTFENIYLKIAKSICKNIILHELSDTDNNNVLSSAYFKVQSPDNKPARIEISTLDIDNNISNNHQNENTIHSFTTDENGNLFLGSETSILNDSSDANIINISSVQNNISYTEQISYSNTKKEIFHFSHEPVYYIKIFSFSNTSTLPNNEFSFSFNNFTSNCIIFNISISALEKTNYSQKLLPLNTGSNINLEHINYIQAELYHIGFSQPFCSFNFKENTPADFNHQIDTLNLHLKDGNIYYAVFKMFTDDNTPISDSSAQNIFKSLIRFQVKSNMIYFEKESIDFMYEDLFQKQYEQLPSLFRVILNTSLLLHDSTCIDTVLCRYNDYGLISKTLLTSLSSPLLQNELSKASAGYIIYIDSKTFDLNLK